jgi:hypothetical protein
MRDGAMMELLRDLTTLIYRKKVCRRINSDSESGCDLRVELGNMKTERKGNNTSSEHGN